MLPALLLHLRRHPKYAFRAGEFEQQFQRIPHPQTEETHALLQGLPFLQQHMLHRQRCCFPQQPPHLRHKKAAAAARRMQQAAAAAAGHMEEATKTDINTSCLQQREQGLTRFTGGRDTFDAVREKS